ncbi:hypothetical protein [Halarcobacter sp.]|uniref:hypothetical protein n=1 Tax=Halarcobacter sp. TaxID=2321133 RepID=UPI002AA8FCE8|nr:hypothetical protein [Halarcobacter sp.]
MSSIDDLVNSFNIGFLSTHINSNDSINLNVNQPEELSNFNETLKEISKEALTPPPTKSVQLDGYTLDENNNQVPTKIIIDGVYAQDSFLDKYGNWDEELEAQSYREKELEYKKEVIEDWLKDMNYDLQSKAELMKALLAKTES